RSPAVPPTCPGAAMAGPRHGDAAPGGSAPGEASARAPWQRAVVLRIRIFEIADLAVEAGFGIGRGFVARWLVLGLVPRAGLAPVPVVRCSGCHGVVLVVSDARH